jgi:hypothetical protein
LKAMAFLEQRSSLGPPRCTSSTPQRDIEKDILEPGAFAGDGLSDYFDRGAPISSGHNTKSFPVGSLQRAVLVRGGSIIQQEGQGAFRYFDGTGTVSVLSVRSGPWTRYARSGQGIFLDRPTEAVGRSPRWRQALSQGW